MDSIQEQSPVPLTMMQKHYRKYPERVKARNVKWMKENPDKMKVIHVRYRKKHAERCRQRAKAFYHTKAKFNPAFKAQAQKRKKLWRAANPGYANAYYHRYKLTPNGRAKIRAASLKRRSLKKKATINLRQITQWIKRVKSRPTAVCYYCEKRVSTDSIHFDHIVPLVSGGPHCVENLCVACAFCNSSKGSKPVTIWLRPGQQLLAL